MTLGSINNSIAFYIFIYIMVMGSNKTVTSKFGFDSFSVYFFSHLILQDMR